MRASKTVTSNGDVRWVLNSRVGNKRSRRYFKTEGLALKAAKQGEAELKKYGQDFASLSGSERAELMLCQRLSKDAGVSMVDAIRSHIDSIKKNAVSPITLGEAVLACLKDKRNMGLARRSMNSLRSTLTRLSSHLGEHTQLSDVSRSSLKSWLVSGVSYGGAAWSSSTRNGYMTDISTLMNWAVSEGFLESNPILGLKDFKPSEEEVSASENREKIISCDDVVRSIQAVWDNDKEILAHVVLGWFAGLRPERELSGVSYSDITDKEVHVRRSLAKTRQDRYIKMTPNLVEWIDFCRANSIPLPAKGFEGRWERVRMGIGLWKDKWSHDGVRHTFASNHLAVHGEAETIKSLGHGNFDMLFKHYRTLVRESDGLKFFEIKPSSPLLLLNT